MELFVWGFAVLWWIILSIVVGVGAENRGRSKGGYIVLSLLFSPFIGGFVVLVLGQAKGYSAPNISSDASSQVSVSTISSFRPYVEHGNEDPYTGKIGETWYCKHCGAQNSVNAVTCATCGEYK